MDIVLKINFSVIFRQVYVCVTPWPFFPPTLSDHSCVFCSNYRPPTPSSPVC